MKLNTASIAAGALLTSVACTTNAAVNFSPTGDGANVFLTENWQGFAQLYCENCVDNVLSDTEDGTVDGSHNVGVENSVTPRVFVQGEFTAALPNGPGLFDMRRFSYVLSMNVESIKTAEAAGFGFDDFNEEDSGVALDAGTDFYGANNYFRIYESGATNDFDTGLDFDSGDLILEGKVSFDPGFDSGFEIDDVFAGLADVGDNENDDSVAQTLYQIEGSLNLLIDVCVGDDILAVGGTAACAGGSESFVDAGYFPNSLFDFNGESDGIAFNVEYNADFEAPGTTTNIPEEMSDGSESGTGETIVLGGNGGNPLDEDARNTFVCNEGVGGSSVCGFIAQSDSTDMSWTTNVVPEPATLALFGLGMVGLGMRRRNAS